jgi:hypothetical protein
LDNLSEDDEALLEELDNDAELGGYREQRLEQLKQAYNYLHQKQPVLARCSSIG